MVFQLIIRFLFLGLLSSHLLAHETLQKGNGVDNRESSLTPEQKHSDAIRHHPCNLLLGKAYKALDEGNFDLALQLGNERVFIEHSQSSGDKYSTVFNEYPQLRMQVENGARKQAEYIARGFSEQQIICDKLHDQYVEYSMREEWQSHLDVMRRRIRVCDGINIDYKVLARVHDVSVLVRKINVIDARLFTADGLSIKLKGNLLQHILLDESIAIADKFVKLVRSGNFYKELVQAGDALVDFINTSVRSNQAGDIAKTSDALDACWFMLDCLNTFINSTCKDVSGIHSVGKGARHTVRMISDPVVAEECLDALGICMYYAGKVAATDFGKIDELVKLCYLKDLIKS